MGFLIWLALFSLSVFLVMKYVFRVAKRDFVSDRNEIGLSVYRKYEVGMNKLVGKMYLKVYVPDQDRVNRIAQIIEESLNEADAMELNISEQHSLEIMFMLTNLGMTYKDDDMGKRKYGVVVLQEWLDRNKQMDEYMRCENLLKQIHEDVQKIIVMTYDKMFSEE